MSAADENAACGTSSIVTAPFFVEFDDDAWIKRTTARFDALGSATTLVWIHCDADSMLTYLRHRGAARDAAKLADWSAYLAKIDTDFRPSTPHVVIDNSSSSEPLQPQAQRLIAHVLGQEP